MRTREDKVTIVTGASMVIGAAITEKLTRERAFVTHGRACRDRLRSLDRGREHRTCVRDKSSLRSLTDPRAGRQSLMVDLALLRALGVFRPRLTPVN